MRPRSHRPARAWLIGHAAAAGILLAVLGPAPAPAQARVPASGKTVARNVIVLISDGMGYNHLAAADIYLFGRPGGQPFESFPVRYAMSTFPGSTSLVPLAPGTPFTPTGYDPLAAWSDSTYVKSRPTDSAAAATTMSCGVKTYNNAIGMSIYGEPLVHAAELAERAGRSAGVVTTVEFSHATPAGFAAHNVSRNSYAAIANEMVNHSALEVIMGAGNPNFDDNGVGRTPSPSSYNYVGGQQTWNALVAGTAGGDCDGDGVADPWTLIQSRDQFVALADGPTPRRVCGVFQAYTTSQQARGGDGMAAPYAVPRSTTVPTLAEMTAGALKVLQSNPKGFFLMVEGGAVDWAAHANQPGRTIEEQIDFDGAVDTVLRWVQKHSSWGETMVIVTGDHETGYLWGPGSGAPATWNPLVSNGVGLMPGMQFGSGDHTNSLIPFFAKGDAARLFHPYATGTDPVRGRYIDNTAIGQVLKTILQ